MVQGGSATIKGIVYQMLWSLSQSVGMQIKSSDVDNGTSENTFLILEPIGGGGDIQKHSSSKVVIQQLKSRADSKTWSLREVIEEVLPDLYKAVDLKQTEVEYQFITDGRMGDWKDVFSFFNSLISISCNPEDIPGKLDDQVEIDFGRKIDSDDSESPFWTESIYTRQSLFKHIVAHIRTRPSIAKKESIEVVSQKVLHLLSKFSFISEQTIPRMLNVIDSQLLSLVDVSEKVVEIRNSMLFDLQLLAADGGAKIDSGVFFSAHGLSNIPLLHWNELKQKGNDILERTTEFLKYSKDEDIRTALAKSYESSWTNGKPILVLLGESGQGKSWLLCSLALALKDDHDHLIVIKATGNTEKDLDKAADIFWQEIKGNDTHLDLSRIGARFRKINPDFGSRWLTLLIDGVQTFEEAEQLAIVPWEHYGIRVAITCSAEIADIVSDNSNNRSVLKRVDDFSIPELQLYLKKQIGASWTEIPSDIVSTLRRPLLSKIYCSLAQGKKWHPTHEYDLYEKYWNRLLTGKYSQYPHDASNLKYLGMGLVNGDSYPWHSPQLKAAGLDNEAVVRLRQIGWLYSSDNEHFEIWHDRLLNWLVAESLAYAFENKTINSAQLLDYLKTVIEKQYAGKNLGYVPMDVIWILTSHNNPDKNIIDFLITGLESAPFYYSHDLYTKLLPTLGNRVVEHLFNKLETILATNTNKVDIHTIVNSLRNIDSNNTSDKALSWLLSDSKHKQRIAMKLLALKPSKLAIERLWHLHCLSEKDPAGYLFPEEDTIWLYHDSFDSLKACVHLDPAWIETAIKNTDPETQPIQTLGYILVTIKNPELYKKCKPHLFEKVDPTKERCLAMAISEYQDRSEIEWLRDHVEKEDDLVGASSLKALIKMDPDIAVKEMVRLSETELYFTRGWCFFDLLLKKPEATHAQILSLLSKAADPLLTARVFQGNENAFTPALLTILLQALETKLERVLDGSLNVDTLYIPLSMISAVQKPELLRTLQKYRESSLERKIKEVLLKIGPQKGNCLDNLERKPALDILFKMNGPAFTEIVNSYLACTDKFGRLQGLEKAAKRPNEITFQLLENISVSDELWDNVPLEQQKATAVLACFNKNDAVINSVLKYGLNSSRYIVSLVNHDMSIQDNTKEKIKQLLNMDEPASGAILACGMLGLKEHLAKIRNIASKNLASCSQTARACSISLGIYKDGADTTLNFLASQLKIKQNKYTAQVALLRISSNSALDILVQNAEIEYDDFVMFTLLNIEYCRNRALQIFEKYLKGLSADSAIEELCSLNSHLSNKAIVVRLLSALRLHDRLRELSFIKEGSSWFVGAKARILKLLSYVDNETAFEGTLAALSNFNSHDREMYPRLIYEIDQYRATDSLLNQLEREKDQAVCSAIGRVLQDINPNHIRNLFASTEKNKILAACRLAGWLSDSQEFIPELLQLLDNENEISAATRKSLKQFEFRKDAVLLVDMLNSSDDLSQKWIILDALFSVADPGDDNGVMPAWLSNVIKDVPYYLKNYIIEKNRNRAAELLKMERKESA